MMAEVLSSFDHLQFVPFIFPEKDGWVCVNVSDLLFQVILPQLRLTQLLRRPQGAEPRLSSVLKHLSRKVVGESVTPACRGLWGTVWPCSATEFSECSCWPPGFCGEKDGPRSYPTFYLLDLPAASGSYW